jgi:hypothetical protein
MLLQVGKLFVPFRIVNLKSITRIKGCVSFQVQVVEDSTQARTLIMVD